MILKVIMISFQEPVESGNESIGPMHEKVKRNPGNSALASR